MDTGELSRMIKAEAAALGFDLAGISRAEQLQQEARDLEQWLAQGRHGTMHYMEAHFDARIDPRVLVPGAKSVISVLHNYFPAPEDRQPPGAPKISRYAWGADYHTVLKGKLYRLFERIRALAGEVAGRVFTDSAPVMDKVWAKRAGLGWTGKHTNLITPRRGSYFFIGEIIVDLELAYDGPVRDFCGTCTRCIDACPTGALEPYRIDAAKCISYLTIELKEQMPEAFRPHLEGWAYGCDICQEVCPWNRFSSPHPGGEFKPLMVGTSGGAASPLTALGAAEWEEFTESAFKKLARRSAISRIKWAKWRDNLLHAAGSTPEP
ncbi:MAG: tRNA epoxyqueuosine(34) reductase QueG [Bacteroidia bacterium]|nr:tRNA epoxyqueuosine(34) reductase QueG [Bacteroidia bacterium]